MCISRHAVSSTAQKSHWHTEEREDRQKSRPAQKTLGTERQINSDRLKTVFSDLG